ncbi:MAG: RagB/SusD protein [Mucilaginibacter sp.]|nr:RagB/SusD protein [Mucilaginibacter sp.]
MKKIFSHKNNILAVCLLIAVSTFVSCKKLLEIPPNSPTAITRAEQFVDSASTLSAVVGTYTYNFTQGFAYGDGYLTMATSLSAHEIKYTSTADQQQFYNYSLTPLNSKVNSLWNYPYSSIYAVNDVLAGVTGNSNLSASFIKQITGEMKVLRALYYFNHVNLFGGVPLPTSTDYSVNAQLPQAPIAAVYAQIMADLADAKTKLSATYPSNQRARPNLYVALALQAKVNLYRENWQAAYNEADSVIKSGVYTLGTPLTGVFLNGSKEAIWQIPVTSSFQGTAEASLFIPSSSTRNPTYVVTDSLLQQFDTGDLRLTTWLGKNVVSGINLYYPAKYKQTSKLTSGQEDYMIFRLGEVYLIRAEAAAQLNNLGQAVTDVNTIRTRAGLGASTVNAASQTAVLAAVRKERRTELCFEWANRWFDLNRTVKDAKYPANGQAAAVLDGYTANYAVYPIPQAQLQLNSHLIQNPGYH